MRTIHITPGISAYYTISKALPQDSYDDIIYCPVDLSVSPLPNDYSDRELFKTIAHSKNVLMFDKLKAFIHYDFSKYDRVVVWHGDISFEMLILYLLSDLVEENKLYEIDLTKSKFMKSLSTKRNWTAYMGEISINDIINADLLSQIQMIPAEKFLEFKKEWNTWRKTKCDYILNNQYGKLKAYRNSLIDKAILQEVNEGMELRKLSSRVYRSLERYGLSERVIIDRIYQLYDEEAIQVFCKK